MEYVPYGSTSGSRYGHFRLIGGHALLYFSDDYTRALGCHSEKTISSNTATHDFPFLFSILADSKNFCQRRTSRQTHTLSIRNRRSPYMGRLRGCATGDTSGADPRTTIYMVDYRYWLHSRYCILAYWKSLSRKKTRYPPRGTTTFSGFLCHMADTYLLIK